MLTLIIALVSSASANDIAVGSSTVVDFVANTASAPATALNLEGGLYRFTNVDGLYDAANPWGGLVMDCNGAGSGCSRGWTTAYKIDASVDGVTAHNGAGIFQTGALAVEASTPLDLCLTATQNVLLINNDTAGGFANNTGGVSVQIQRLSEADNCDNPIDLTDWVIVTANAAFGSDILDEASPKNRLRPSVVHAHLDALEAEATGLGCDSFEDIEWAGSYANGSWSGSTEDGESVIGTFGGGVIAATVDGAPAGDLYGSFRRGRGMLNVGPATNGAAGQYIRFRGTRGVWVGGEITCPSDTSLVLNPWIRGN